jgi:8-oxo-dGTP diphosphatase
VLGTVGTTLRGVQHGTRTQRLGAYAVLVRDETLLVARVSALGFPPGWWGLPGGGVDHGESPADAMIRELHEEAGLVPSSWRLVDVHDNHTVAPGRGDQYEDYHGIHLLYAVGVDAGVEPRVVEEGGTTDEVRWVPLADLRSGEFGPLLPVVEHVLDRLDQFAI